MTRSHTTRGWPEVLPAAVSLLTVAALTAALVLFLTAGGNPRPVTHTVLAGGRATTASGKPSAPLPSPPAFTSPAEAAFAVGRAGVFQAAVTQPLATIGQAGPLPRGLSWTQGANGTATIFGTPAPGSGGAYPVILTATGPQGASTQQSLTIAVSQAPAFTTTDTIWGTALFNVNQLITTTGYPAPRLTLTGYLPSGLRFTDSGNGTARISGVPEVHPNLSDILEPWKLVYNSYTVTVTATNPSGDSAMTITLHIFFTLS